MGDIQFIVLYGLRGSSTKAKNGSTPAQTIGIIFGSMGPFSIFVSNNFWSNWAQMKAFSAQTSTNVTQTNAIKKIWFSFRWTAGDMEVLFFILITGAYLETILDKTVLFEETLQILKVQFGHFQIYVLCIFLKIYSYIFEWLSWSPMWQWFFLFLGWFFCRLLGSGAQNFNH